MAKNIVAVDLPSAPLATVDELRTMLARMEEQANLVTPVVHLDYIPPYHRVSLRAVKLDSTVDSSGNGDDVYADRQFCKQNERAPAKRGLMKIWSAAGGSIVESFQTDNCKNPFYVSWSVTVELLQLDGKTTKAVGSKTLDWRDGSPQISGWSEKQLLSVRKHICQHAETKALLRAIRLVLFMKDKYTVDELEKLFVIPALVLDLSDPAVKQMALQSMFKSESALYGGDQASARLEPMATDQDITIGAEPIDDDSFVDPFQASAEAPEPAPLPIPDSVINEVPTTDERRFNLFGKMNQLAERAIGLFGEEKSNAAFRKCAHGVDWLKVGYDDINTLFDAISKELKGGAK